MVIGGQGSGQAVRGEQGEDDAEAERREKIFRRPLEKDHGNKDAAYGERRDQRRHGDAGRSVQGRLRQRPALLRQKTVRIFDRYRRIIDQDTDGKRQPAECHRVERIAEEIEDDEKLSNASGIEIMTTRIDRNEPRNRRIIRAVRPAAIVPS